MHATSLGADLTSTDSGIRSNDHELPLYGDLLADGVAASTLGDQTWFTPV